MVKKTVRKKTNKQKIKGEENPIGSNGLPPNIQVKKVDYGKLVSRVGAEGANFIKSLANTIQQNSQNLAVVVQNLSQFFNNHTQDENLTRHRIKFIFKLIDQVDRKAEALGQSLIALGTLSNNRVEKKVGALKQLIIGSEIISKESVENFDEIWTKIEEENNRKIVAERFNQLWKEDGMERSRIVKLNGDIIADVVVFRYNFRIKKVESENN